MDPELMARAQADLDKLNFVDPSEKKEEDKRSMLEIMKEKRAKAEAELKNKQPVDDGGETVE